MNLIELNVASLNRPTSIDQMSISIDLDLLGKLAFFLRISSKFVSCLFHSISFHFTRIRFVSSHAIWIGYIPFNFNAIHSHSFLPVRYHIGGSKSSWPASFSADLRSMSLVFHLFMIVLPLLPDHPLESFHPRQKDRNESFSVNFAENWPDGTFQVLPTPAIKIGQFSFKIPEEEEVTRSTVWTVNRMLQPSGPICAKTFLGSPRIVRTCVVKMDHESFQRLPTITRCDSLN
jgi:hypothetical protein